MSDEEELTALREELAALEAERASFVHSAAMPGSDDAGGIGSAGASEEIELPAEIELIRERIAELEERAAERE